ncbi:MAG: VanZ family protein [Phycisphaerales bacterium]|nr:VanZ family protein [Phycisphaerales bacterium]
MIPPRQPSAPPDRRPPRTRRARVAFALYALVLVTATHWPELVIQAPSFSRLDLVVHAGAFGCWAVLLTLAGFCGRPLSRRNISISALIALGYSAIDEVSQALPFVRRSVDASDLAANWAGIVLAAIVLLGWSRMRSGDPSDR